VSILARRRVEHEQHRMGRLRVYLFEDADDLLQLAHQIGLVVQPSGGIDEQNVAALHTGLFESLIGEPGRI
jgi:F420-0:gamma-glutamyl ligase